MHNLDHPHHRPMHKKPAIEGFQLLMSHLFNVCNKTPIFPITKASAVFVKVKDEDGNEYEKSLQEYLDELDIDNISIIIPEGGIGDNDDTPGVDEPADVTGDYDINDVPEPADPDKGDLMWSDGKTTYTLNGNGDSVTTKNGANDGTLKLSKMTIQLQWTNGATSYLLVGNGATVTTKNGAADGELKLEKNG